MYGAPPFLSCFHEHPSTDDDDDDDDAAAADDDDDDDDDDDHDDDDDVLLGPSALLWLLPSRISFDPLPMMPVVSCCESIKFTGQARH